MSKVDLGFDSKDVKGRFVTHLLDVGRYAFKISGVSFSNKPAPKGSVMVRAKVVGTMNGKFLGCSPGSLFIRIPDDPKKHDGEENVLQQIAMRRQDIADFMRATDQPPGSTLDMDLCKDKIVVADVAILKSRINETTGKEYADSNTVNRWIHRSEWQGEPFKDVDEPQPGTSAAAPPLPPAPPVGEDEDVAIGD